MIGMIIYGPPGCGKSRHAESLRLLYGCTRVIDPWDGRTPLQKGDLALTNLRPPYPARGQALVMPYEMALRGSKR